MLRALTGFALLAVVFGALGSATSVGAAGPIARFDWSMADRYIDRDRDGFNDPSNTPGQVSEDFVLKFDACASTGGGGAISSYKWERETSAGHTESRTVTDCTLEWAFPKEGTFNITLTVKSDNGTDSRASDVVVRDFLVVSIGDSYAAGEGSPYRTLAKTVDFGGEQFELPYDADWESERCHRSAVAGAAQAARWLEKSDPKTSVTFVATACSGAKLADSEPGDDKPEGGILDPYAGVEPPSDMLPWSRCKGKPLPLDPKCPLPPQLDEVEWIVGNQEIDALLVGIGGNDMGFAPIITDCLLPVGGPCSEGGAKDIFDAGIVTLPGRYQRLNDELERRFGARLKSQHVVLSEYPDPTRDDDGSVCDPLVRSPISPFVDMFSRTEAAWISREVVPALNKRVKDATVKHQWTYAGGAVAAFLGPPGHGLCAEGHWLQTIPESIANLGLVDINGAFHPCAEGYGVYRDALSRAMISGLDLPYKPTVPGKDLVIGVQCSSPPGNFFADRDGDFVADIFDNCPMVYNFPVITLKGLAQEDEGNGVQKYTKGDGVGDACAGFTVNTSGDGKDGNLKDRICDGGDALADPPTTTEVCSLRAAIEQANYNGKQARITFNIGSGVKTIAVGSALPIVHAQITFDGTTQKSPLSGIPVVDKITLRCFQLLSHPCVELNGVATTSGLVSGLHFGAKADRSVVSTLVINRFSGYGIEVSLAGFVSIEGNFIGTDPKGRIALGNKRGGVLFGGASDGHVGGGESWQRNVVSGNGGNGVSVGIGSLAVRNVIQGNLIGTDVTGYRAIPNAGDGVFLNANRNVIGGDRFELGNTISGNRGNGIGIFGGPGVAGNTVIAGNRIGTAIDSRQPLGNHLSGISLLDESGKDTIGGPGARGNVIARNGRNGIFVAGGPGHDIQANSIFDNGFPKGLGIDISDCGICSGDPTPNDDKDVDPGANDRQNYPVLAKVEVSDSGVDVEGTLNSRPNTMFRIDLYASDGCDPSRFGEGDRFLGSTSVQTDANGNGGFSVEYNVTVGPAAQITATATNPGRSTSEFSLARGLGGNCPAPLVVNSPTDAPDGDLNDGKCDTGDIDDGLTGLCTLRAAIQNANKVTGADEIRFSIGSGPVVIQPATNLPAITERVVVDATTQPGYANRPLIELRGGAGAANGLSVVGGDTTIRGFAINSFPNFGIVLDSKGGNRVEGNYIGTNIGGALDKGNGGDGILVKSAGNTIGGIGFLGNVISGNHGYGVHVYGAAATGNVIQGNRIGTNAAGTLALPNDVSGVRITGATTIVGGLNPGEGNVLSGNARYGLELLAAENVVVGNLIGTNAAGDRALGNGKSGVIVGGAANAIGGTGLGAGNTISGNGEDGIVVPTGIKGTKILGNFIGPDSSGRTDVGNRGNGLYIVGLETEIGSKAAGGGNTISGNDADGIAVYGLGTVIVANMIGTQSDGVLALGNGKNGIGIYGPGRTTIGGPDPAESNRLYFNKANAILVSSGLDTVIQGNRIYRNGSKKGLGIDLGDCGGCSAQVTPNDPGDADLGANGRQNYPEIASATFVVNSVTAVGVLKSARNTEYQLDFYASQYCDSSGFGEGERPIGSTVVTTDGGGQAQFKVAGLVAQPLNEAITVTATGPDGTSEFSKCAKVASD